MNKKVCIVIPIYKSELDIYEKLSISLVEKKLSCFDIYFVTYKGLDLKNYARYTNIKIIYFPKRFFKNTISYSKLLLKEKFYRKFFGYTYMMIVQTDALILGDVKQLEMFMDKHYDYWGARWEEPVEIHSFEVKIKLKKMIKKRFPKNLTKIIFKNPKYCSVGNGGLSLRNIKKTIALLRDKKINAKVWMGNEDKFFAYYGSDNNVNFRIAPVHIVDKFSLESYIIPCLDEVKPFGVHAWESKGKNQVLHYLDRMREE